MAPATQLGEGALCSAGYRVANVDGVMNQELNSKASGGAPRVRKIKSQGKK